MPASQPRKGILDVADEVILGRVIADPIKGNADLRLNEEPFPKASIFFEGFPDEGFAAGAPIDIREIDLGDAFGRSKTQQIHDLVNIHGIDSHEA